MSTRETLAAARAIVGTTGDTGALDTLAAMMSGEEWDSDTLDDIADVIRQTGRTIAEYPPPPAEIVRVTYNGHRATFEQPAEPTELVIRCPLVGRETDARVWNNGDARCLGDSRHNVHAVQIADPNEPDDDIDLQAAIDRARGITP